MSIIEDLREALKEAIDEYEYAYPYKGDFLSKKHGDPERVAKLRAVLVSQSKLEEMTEKLDAAYDGESVPTVLAVPGPHCPVSHSGMCVAEPACEKRCKHRKVRPL